MPASDATGSSTRRIAVVGQRDIVVAFRASGLAVFPVTPGPEAAEVVRGLVSAGYRVVFFTEDLFDDLMPLLERYRKEAVPCLVALPRGDIQQSVARLKEIVKKAVGADVFGTAEVTPRKE